MNRSAINEISLNAKFQDDERFFAAVHWADANDVEK